MSELIIKTRNTAVKLKILRRKRNDIAKQSLIKTKIHIHIKNFHYEHHNCIKFKYFVSQQNVSKLPIFFLGYGF